MAERVRVTETLRDAWQGLPHVVPTEAKIAFAQALLDAGFTALDVGSFVSRERVPAMADTADVLAGLDRPAGCRITALVANARGLDRLLEARGVDEVLYPFSLSETFQQRNTRRSRAEALQDVTALTARAHDAGRTLYATISMAFGNNEGDPFEPRELRDWIARLEQAGVDRIGLADTTAQATPRIVRDVFEAVAARAGGSVPAVHLHCTEETQEPLVDAALAAGCRDFDAALGGLGGCQFARGPESNVSTLPLARQLSERGFACDLPLEALEALDGNARRLAVAPGAT